MDDLGREWGLKVVRWWASIVVMAGVGACTAVPAPTPAPPTQVLVDEVVSVTVVRPSTTPSPPPITPTPTSLPDLIWSESVEIVAALKNGSLTWSPQANKFLYAVCLPEADQSLTRGTITLKSLPTKSAAIVAQDFFCPGPDISVTWTPDGQQFLFTGLSPETVNDAVISETADIWLADAAGNAKTLLTAAQIATRWSPHFSFWLDDDTFLYSGYGGGGHTSSALVNIEANSRSQLAFTHVCGLSDFSSQYLVGCAGIFTTSYISAIAIPLAEMWAANFDLRDTTIPVEQYFLSRPKPIYLSYSGGSATDEFAAFDFNSIFMDWLPETNQMLVLTWDTGLDLMADAPVTTRLQLWDVATDSLALLVPEGVYGRFSPDGRFLAYFTPDDGAFSLNLLDRDTGEHLFSRPALLNESEGAYSAPLSFSPDGRYFTFYDANTNLLIFNLDDGTFLAPLTAIPTKPVWSPDSARLVYQDSTSGLSILDIPANTAYPLAVSGGRSLSNPQWSFDGLYLSVKVAQDGGWETAVLTLP